MKKFFCILLSMALVFSLTSCKATLREALEKQADVMEYKEFDLSTCFSEEEGYHFPNCPWGSTATDFQENNYYPIQKAVAYGVNGESYYSANLRTALLGRTNDEAQIAITKDEDLYMVYYIFSSEELEEGELSQSELYDQYLQKLTETFGEPTGTEINSVSEDSVTTYTEACHWDYTTAEGVETELQFSKAYTVEGAEPLYISFGFVWMNGVVTDETE